jgi:tetratricopeptide (TPR) repeat protein
MDDRARLVQNLKDLGVLKSGRVERAFCDLPARVFTRPELHTFANCDVPWPNPGAADFTLSPRLCVLMAELLEANGRHRILVTGTQSPLLAHLLERLGARVDDAPVPRALYDRALIVDGDWPQEAKARRQIRNGGFLLRLRLDPLGESLVKYLFEEGAWIRMGLNGLRLGKPRTIRPPQAPRAPSLLNMLIVEGILRRVWREERERPEDDQYADAVMRTWAPPQSPDSSRETLSRLLLARKFFHMGYILQSMGEAATALDLYTASSRTMPTAEAFTFRSWALALEGRFDEAIQECLKAIALDPNFGNPYNDIGAYLLEQGRAKEALPWLEKAKKAPRYQAPHYAHVNAGRAHLMLGKSSQARQEFRAALRLAPDYEPARKMLDMLDK